MTAPVSQAQESPDPSEAGVEPNRSGGAAAARAPMSGHGSSVVRLVKRDGERAVAPIPAVLDARAQAALLRKAFGEPSPRAPAQPGTTLRRLHDLLLGTTLLPQPVNGHGGPDAAVSPSEPARDPAQHPEASAPATTNGVSPQWASAAPIVINFAANPLSLRASVTGVFLDLSSLETREDSEGSSGDRVPRPMQASVFDKSRAIGGTRAARAEKIELSSSLLRNAASKIRSIIHETRDLGIRSVQDLEILIAADQELPSETPPSQLIDTMREIDSARLGVLIGQHRKLLKAAEELSSAPDLSAIPTEALRNASNLKVGDAESEYLQHSPAEAFAEAAKRIEDSNSLITAIECTAPALDLFGFDRSFPVNGLDAVALAVIVAARLGPSHRIYLGCVSSGGGNAFLRARAKWSELVAAENEWRQRLPGYAEQGDLSPEELDAAALYFAGSALQRARADFAGKSAAVRQLVQRLGFDARAATASEDLAALGNHLRALRRFCGNGTYQRMFGSAWAGLDTPFDEITAAIRAIQKIREHFFAVPHGRRVFDRLVLLEPEQLEALGALAPAMKPLRDLADGLRSRLDESSIDALTAELKGQRDLAKAILDADREQVTAKIDLPVAKIRKLAAQELVRRELEDSVVRDPLAPLVKNLVSDEETAEAALKAVTWAGIVRRKELPNELRSWLLSANAARARARMRDLAARVLAVLKELEHHTAKFEERLGVNSLFFLSPTDWLKQVDRLVSAESKPPRS
jgi:hypothetical protein